MRNLLNKLGIDVLRHNRVIPRDFFNESKLLKCFGRLSLLILDNEIQNIAIKESGEPFDIVTVDDGLTVLNYPVKIKGVYYLFSSKYNSKDAYNFRCIDSEWNETNVFEQDGTLTEEFLELLK